MSLQFRDLVGAEIVPYIERLAELRIAVFREWPYLYEGDMDYERGYLRKLGDSPHAYVVLALHGESVVGASTALPLLDAESEFQQPFLAAGLNPEDYFYFGESVLLPQYRGQKAGVRFFEEREAQAEFLGFPQSCFCAVIRPEDHPARPPAYRPLDRLWSRRGFRRVPELRTTFAWRDLGHSEETAKEMEFWVKPAG